MPVAVLVGHGRTVNGQLDDLELGVPETDPPILDGDLQLAYAVRQTRCQPHQGGGRAVRIPPQADRFLDRILADLLVAGPGPFQDCNGSVSGLEGESFAGRFGLSPGGILGGRPECEGNDGSRQEGGATSHD